MMLELLVRASIEGAVLVVLVWTAIRLLPGLPPATRAFLWWCAAAKFVLTLAWIAPIELPVLPARMSLDAASSEVSSPLDPLQTAPRADAEGAAAFDRASRVDWLDLVLGIWVAGVAAAAGLSVRRWHQLAGVVRQSVAAPDCEAVLSDLSRRLGLRRAPRIRLSDRVATPLVTGAITPTVLLPSSAFARLSPRQQELAICHELAHLTRADLWLGCVPALAERLFFFHPLVRIASREYALHREAACDAAVMQALDASPQEYGRLLLDFGVSQRRPALAAAGAAWSFSTLKRRLAMLGTSHARSYRNRLLAAAAVVAVVAALVPLRLAASREQRQRDEQRPRELNYVLLLDDDHSQSSGSMTDIERARRLRTSGERLLWFRHNGREYVVRDPQALDQVIEIWRPVNELGNEMGRLGGQQGALGARQGQVGARQGALGAEQGALGARQGALGSRQAALAAREVRARTDEERRAIEEERRTIDTEMRALDAKMRELDARMREISKPMDDLSAEMDVLGKEMGRLGKTMEEVSAKAETETSALLERLLATGVAQSVR